MGTMEIRDDHKRQFALGFEFCFLNQRELNQTGIAIAAGVDPGDISNIRRGNEGRFPGFKKQRKIAAVFNKEVHELVLKGREIEEGKEKIPETNSKTSPSSGVKESEPTYDAPFPRYFEVMDLPYSQRPMMIMQIAANEYEFGPILGSWGDPQLSEGEYPQEIQDFLDQKITEKELYQHYRKLFKRLAKKVQKEIYGKS